MNMHNRRAGIMSCEGFPAISQVSLAPPSIFGVGAPSHRTEIMVGLCILTPVILVADNCPPSSSNQGRELSDIMTVLEIRQRRTMYRAGFLYQ